MARWYEGAEESAFKPVAGGYVFQMPSWSWPFGRSAGYLVNETQKEAIAACLRRQRGQTLLLMLGLMLVGVAGGLIIAMGHPQSSLSTGAIVAVFAVVLAGSFAVALVPYLIAMRAIRPLLTGLPRTDERITMNEQLQRLAGAISPKVLWVAGVSGCLSIIAAFVSIADELAEGRAGSMLPQTLWLVFGVLLTSYFIYLIILRRRAKAGAN